MNENQRKARMRNWRIFQLRSIISRLERIRNDPEAEVGIQSDLLRAEVHARDALLEIKRKGGK